MVTPEFIRSIPIFTKLESHQLQILLEKLHRHRYQRNEVIFHQGDPADRMHIIVEGRVKISIASEDGRETNIALFQRGDCFGEMALLDGSQRSATATAILPSETAVLFRDDFLTFLNGNPVVASEVNSMLVRRLRNSNEFLGDMVFLDVPTRVAKYLISLAEANSEPASAEGTAVISIGHDELAHLVGASRETVSRALNSYRRMGIIRTSHRRITIIDSARLQRMTSF